MVGFFQMTVDPQSRKTMYTEHQQHMTGGKVYEKPLEFEMPLEKTMTGKVSFPNTFSPYMDLEDEEEEQKR